MKTKGIIIIALLVLGIAISGCKKQENKKNIKGTWTLDQYYLDGVDQTEEFHVLFQGYQINFTDKENYIESYTGLGFLPTSTSGTYDIDKTTLNLNDNVNGARAYNIDELTSNLLQVTKKGTSEEYYLVK